MANTCHAKISENGKFSLDIIDDRKQDKPGGIDNPRTYIYDPATGNFDEVGLISKFEYAVVECPVPEPSTLLLLGSGVAGIIGFGRKRLLGKRKNV